MDVNGGQGRGGGRGDGEGPGGVIRVALADDQMLVRAGFAMVVDSQDDMTVAWQADDGTQAIELAAAEGADVILMDIRMPGVDGIEATRRILGAAGAGGAGSAGPRILVLTTFDVDEYVTDAIAAGASGFLLKDAAPEDLLAAIRDVAAGDSALSARSAARLIAKVRPLLGTGEASAGSGRAGTAGADLTGAGTAGSDLPGTAGDSAAPGEPAVRDDLPEPLTLREEEILRLMAMGRTNQEIGDELFIAMPTVKTHVGRILMKTGSRDRVHAVLFAVRTGRVGVNELG